MGWLNGVGVSAVQAPKGEGTFGYILYHLKNDSFMHDNMYYPSQLVQIQGNDSLHDEAEELHIFFPKLCRCHFKHISQVIKIPQRMTFYVRSECAVLLH